jgi:hypothetical protein
LALIVNPSPSGDCHAYVGKKKYKPVAKKVKPIGATLLEEFCIVRNIQGDPLADLPILSPFPIDFLPTGCYDQASFDIIEKNHPHGFLTAEERRFMHHFMMIHQDGFAWNKTQKGLFCKDFFPPVCIAITEHIPWVLRNMPIPPGIYNAILDSFAKRLPPESTNNQTHPTDPAGLPSFVRAAASFALSMICSHSTQLPSKTQEFHHTQNNSLRTVAAELHMAS